MKLLKNLFPYIILCISFYGYAQDSQVCKDFYLKCKADSSNYWSINEKSHTFNVFPGSVVEIKMEILKGKDYQVSLCGDDFIGNVFHYKILDKENKLLYDNEDDGFSTTFSFSCLETKDIKLDIKIPDTGSSASGCLGVLIEETLSVSTGF